MLLLFIMFSSCENDEKKGDLVYYSVKREIRIDDGGVDNIISTYKYENNRLIEENFAGQALFTYEYNDTSVLFKIEDTYDGRLYKVSRTIIKNDLATKLISLWPKDGIGDLMPTGETVIYNYDSENNLIETKEYDDSVLISKTIYTWDSNGNLTKKESFDPENPDTPYSIDEYSYFLDRVDIRDYGLSYQGKNSKHLVEAWTSTFLGRLIISQSYSYTFDKYDRPATCTTIFDDGGSSVISYEYY